MRLSIRKAYRAIEKGGGIKLISSKCGGEWLLWGGGQAKKETRGDERMHVVNTKRNITGLNRVLSIWHLTESYNHALQDPKVLEFHELDWIVFTASHGTLSFHASWAKASPRVPFLFLSLQSTRFHLSFVLWFEASMWSFIWWPSSVFCLENVARRICLKRAKSITLLLF